MNLEDELVQFQEKVHLFMIENCPSWLSPNSYWYGVIPGHNLDLLQISFDLLIDRKFISKYEIPDSLKDPSKPDLKVIK